MKKCFVDGVIVGCDKILYPYLLVAWIVGTVYSVVWTYNCRFPFFSKACNWVLCHLTLRTDHFISMSEVCEKIHTYLQNCPDPTGDEQTEAMTRDSAGEHTASGPRPPL